MALRNIVKEGEEILKKISRPVKKFDEKLFILLDDMIDTMSAANGVGLAAPQVGILRRVVVIDIGEGLIELVNPEFLLKTGEQECVEGCLSIPGEYGVTKRPKQVKVKAQNRQGAFFELEANGYLTNALCHEIDHLQGILFKTIATRMLSPEELEERSNSGN